MSEVLFTITKDHLETGLRGFPVGYCITSSVDPSLGLYYAGYPIKELAHKEPEEIIYLLFNRELPNNEQLSNFKKQLIEHSNLDKRVIESLKTLPKEGHPMKWLIHGLNIMGMVSCTKDYRKDAINVVAQLPELVAAIYRIRSGLGEPIKSQPELGYMENFVNMLGLENANPNLLKVMKVFNVLHYDHEGGNLSTFVGKAVASGLADMYDSLLSAMAALAGPFTWYGKSRMFKILKRSIIRSK
ncbi:MAG: hypothetical protein KatS3mg068_2574 [Candidatus Sericytochromatia bacterium]|nr:MAG: hypothetical protein KatS3mg068_2574 [Candidatus Sericytochromatia bacterium]